MDAACSFGRVGVDGAGVGIVGLFLIDLLSGNSAVGELGFLGRLLFGAELVAFLLVLLDKLKGFVQAAKELLHVFLKDGYLVAVALNTFLSVLALYNLLKDVAGTVFLYVKKIRAIGQSNLCCV